MTLPISASVGSAGGNLGRQANVLGQLEIRPHVHRHRDRGRGAGLDRPLLDADDAQDVELLLLEGPLVGLGDDLLLEFIGNLLGEPLDHQRRRGLARPEAGKPGEPDILAEDGLVLGVDLGLVHGDDEVLTGVGDGA